MVTFAAVVEASSFSGAARKLGVTKAAVSKHVSSLEEELGVRLLHRTTRRLRLTEVGRAYYERCAQLVQVADEADRCVRGDDAAPRGRLRVSAPVGVGQSLVAPLVARFSAVQPRLEVELLLDDAMVDLIDADIDVAVRAGRLADSSLIARKLAPLELLVVSSPAYLRRHGEPTNPNELMQHAWLGYTPLGDPQRLRLRRAGGRAVTTKHEANVRTNDGAVLRAWLLEGIGITVLPRFFVRDAVAAGALSVVMPDYQIDAGAIYAVHPHGRRPPPKVRLFIDALVAAF
jgi:DNA-binding transcriptional LysR family regulator